MLTHAPVDRKKGLLEAAGGAAPDFLDSELSASKPGHSRRFALSSRECGGTRAARLGRKPDRGADASLEDGIGLGAVGGRARQLQRPGEEPQERRRVGAAHLLALP